MIIKLCSYTMSAVFFLIFRFDLRLLALYKYFIDIDIGIDILYQIRKHICADIQQITAINKLTLKITFRTVR